MGGGRKVVGEPQPKPFDFANREEQLVVEEDGIQAGEGNNRARCASGSGRLSR